MSDAVQQIKERLPILDVVGGYVQLKKAGRHYKGKSPFTNEKTPSFFVSPDRGMYYCFSTSQGGDIFTFIEVMEGVDFKGALKILADRAGVELVPEDPKKKTEREKLYALIEEACVFFEQGLKREKTVREYLNNRGVKDTSTTMWRIGFAPDEWRTLKEHLRAKGYSEALILKSGLIKKTDESANSYDVFRNRVMFPIADASGRIVAFSGRAMTSDPNTPKYVNSPETVLYQKSDILFGYDKARQGIRQHDFSLIVEGQFDLVLAHQAGYTNTVAISGTALTPSHVSLLQRLSEKTVLALDSDTAGINSIKRGAELMLARGMDVKVARIEEGKDPADLVKEDPALLRKAVGGGVHVVEFLIGVLKEKAKEDRTFKLRVRDEVLPFLVEIPNRIDREHFEEVIATELKTTKDAIHYEVERLAEQSIDAEETERALPREIQEVRVGETNGPVHPTASNARAGAQRVGGRSQDLMLHLLGILLWQEGLEDQSIDAKEVRRRFKEILGADAYDALLSTQVSAKNKGIFEAEELYGGEGEATRLAHIVEESLEELKIRGLKNKLKVARNALQVAEREGDTKEINKLLEECGNLQKQLSLMEKEG